MKIWSRSKPTIETKSLSDPSAEELCLFGASVPGGITRAQAIGVPAVNAAIRAHSEAAATLPIKVVRLEPDGSETDQPTHPVAKFLRGPINPWTPTTFPLIRDLTATALTRDEGGIAEAIWIENRLVEIVLYAPGTIEVAHDPVTREPSYRIGDRQIDPDHIVHLRGPFDRCPLSLAMPAISVAYHLENHALNLFKKGARPGGVVKFKKSLGDEGLKKMRAGWRAAFSGSDNAGETAILWDDADFQQLTMSSTDAQFLENRRFAVEEIARAFGVPVSMLGDTTKTSYANGEQRGKEFLMYGLEPWLCGLEAALRRALFTDEERGSFKVVFERDDISRVDLTARATAINSLRASKVLSANEARSWLDLAPYDGGDVYENTNITLNQEVQP